jgi:hypothetical protein
MVFVNASHFLSFFVIILVCGDVEKVYIQPYLTCGKGYLGVPILLYSLGKKAWVVVLFYLAYPKVNPLPLAFFLLFTLFSNTFGVCCATGTRILRQFEKTADPQMAHLVLPDKVNNIHYFYPKLFVSLNYCELSTTP